MTKKNMCTCNIFSKSFSFSIFRHKWSNLGPSWSGSLRFLDSVLDGSEVFSPIPLILNTYQQLKWRKCKKGLWWKNHEFCVHISKFLPCSVHFLLSKSIIWNCLKVTNKSTVCDPKKCYTKLLQKKICGGKVKHYHLFDCYRLCKKR